MLKIPGNTLVFSLHAMFSSSITVVSDMKSESSDVNNAVVCNPVLAGCWQGLYCCCCW